MKRTDLEFSNGDRIHVINMTPPDAIECAMCPAVGDFRHAVPYYCGPVREGQSDGGYRCVCKPCYDRWEKWNDSLQYYGA